MVDGGDGGVDEDGTVETLFGKSPLGLSKKQSRVDTSELLDEAEYDKKDRNNYVRKKLIADDCLGGQRGHGGSQGQVPDSSAAKDSVIATSEQGELGEDDLYGDLYCDDPMDSSNDKRTLGNSGVGILRLKVSKLMSDVAAKDSVIAESQTVIRGLQERMALVEEENKILKYNISSLFNTAKLEMERKGREIEANRTEIQRLKRKLGTSPKEPKN